MSDLVLATPGGQIDIHAIANSTAVPQAYRGKPNDVYFAALLGQEYGWNPAVALTKIQVIQGMPSLKTEAKLGLVRAAGHSVEFKEDPEAMIATATGTRADNGDTHTCSFSMEEAKKAGLTKNPVWQNYPLVMLRWRAVGQLCGALFSDVVSGILSPDEATEVARLTAPHSRSTQPPSLTVIPPAEGKKRLLSVVGGDKAAAKAHWDGWVAEHGEPQTPADLDALLSAAIPEAEIVEIETPAPTDTPLVEEAADG